MYVNSVSGCHRTKSLSVIIVSVWELFRKRVDVLKITRDTKTHFMGKIQSFWTLKQVVCVVTTVLQEVNTEFSSENLYPLIFIKWYIIRLASDVKNLSTMSLHPFLSEWAIIPVFETAPSYGHSEQTNSIFSYCVNKSWKREKEFSWATVAARLNQVCISLEQRKGGWTLERSTIWKTETFPCNFFSLISVNKLTGLVTSYVETASKTSYRRKDRGRDGSDKKTRKNT